MQRGAAVRRSIAHPGAPAAPFQRVNMPVSAAGRSRRSPLRRLRAARIAGVRFAPAQMQHRRASAQRRQPRLRLRSRIGAPVRGRAGTPHRPGCPRSARGPARQSPGAVRPPSGRGPATLALKNRSGVPHPSCRSIRVRARHTAPVDLQIAPHTPASPLALAAPAVQSGRAQGARPGSARAWRETASQTRASCGSRLRPDRRLLLA